MQIARRYSVFIGMLMVMNQGLACAEPIHVVDDRGRSVTLVQPAQRVITIGPSVTELVYAAGAGDTVIAVDNASDYPVGATLLPRVGGLSALDLEKIIALRPDLIVVWNSGYRSGAVETMAAIATIYYADPKSLLDIAATIEKLGILTGRQNQANLVRQQFINEMATLQQRYRHRQPIPAFYQVWLQPLMSIGKTHSINSVMELCGVHNIFADSELIVPRIDIEQVLIRKPRMIIVTDEYNGDATKIYWQRWLPELQNYTVSINSALLTRPTPRILQGTAQLCEFADKIRAEDAKKGQTQSRLSLEGW